jgi:hypothetical protein
MLFLIVKELSLSSVHLGDSTVFLFVLEETNSLPEDSRYSLSSSMKFSILKK